MTVHEGQRDYKCDTCGKCFGLSNSLNKHIQAVHEKVMKVKKHTCHICGKSFEFPSNLRTHNKLVHEDEKHQCNQCNQFFSTKEVLHQHIKYVHEKVKEAHCEICGKEFGRKGDLKKHMSIHEGIKTNKE